MPAASPLGNTWTTIESDPGVFTALIHAMGCKDIQVEELLTLSPEALTLDSRAGSKVFGLIFLFHFDEKVEQKIEERIREKRQVALMKKQETELQMRYGGNKTDADIAVNVDGEGTAPPAADTANVMRPSQEKEQEEIPELPSIGVNPDSLEATPIDQDANGNGAKKKEGESEGNVVATVATVVSQSDKSEPTPSLPPPTTTAALSPTTATDDGVFFAHQVVANACATQAVLGVLLNADEEGEGRVDLGDTLKGLKTFAKDFPPDLKGAAIGGCDPIRIAHNSFAKPDPFVHETSSSSRGGADEDVFHFISYVPIKGKVYELDGLKEAPDCLGSFSFSASSSSGDAAWLELAFSHIQEKIRLHSEIGAEGRGGFGAEIRFNLLALVRDRRVVLREQLSSASSDARRAEIHAELVLEEKRHEAWRLENERRRHNYIPFIFTLLKAMSEKGKLKAIIDDAMESKAKKKAKRS